MIIIRGFHHLYNYDDCIHCNPAENEWYERIQDGGPQANGTRECIVIFLVKPRDLFPTG